MDVLAFVVPAVIVIGTVAFMEVFAWWVHKYIMHGEMGWGWHKSHHEPYFRPLASRYSWVCAESGFTCACAS